MEQPSIRPGSGVGPGVLAGVIAGIVLAAFRVITAAAAGGDATQPLETASAPLLGERVLVPGLDVPALLVGLVIHLAISVFWGAAFGLFFHGLGKRGTVLAGALYGVAVWFVMFYVVLPLAGLAEIAAATAVRTALVEHVLFGLAVGAAFAPFQRRYGEYWGPAADREAAPAPA